MYKIKSTAVALLLQRVMGQSVKVQGDVIKGCESVREQFQSYFDQGMDQSSQLAVYVGDRLIIDLYGDSTGVYGPDSLQTVFSSGKSVAAILMGMMASKGLIEWEAPVTTYWPEFGQNGKDFLTVANIMQHEGGLPSFSKKIDLEWCRTENIKKNMIGKIIEEETLFWFQQKKQDEPTSMDERVYHAFSRDWISNEIFRRVEPKGRTMVEFLREEFPDLDVYNGIQDPNVMSRVQDLRWMDPAAFQNSSVYNPDEWAHLAAGAANAPELVPETEERTARKAMIEGGFIDKPEYAEDPMFGYMNSKDWRAAEMVSASTSASARGLAKLGTWMAQRGTADGRTIMSEKAWDDFHAGLDRRADMSYFPYETAFTNGGVALNVGAPRAPDGYYGWMGYGGSIFQWHPEEEISFSYVPLDLNPDMNANNNRGAALQRVVYDCVTGNGEGSDGEWSDGEGSDGEGSTTIELPGWGTVEMDEDGQSIYISLGGNTLAISSTIASVLVGMASLY